MPVAPVSHLLHSCSGVQNSWRPELFSWHFWFPWTSCTTAKRSDVRKCASVMLSEVSLDLDGKFDLYPPFHTLCHFLQCFTYKGKKKKIVALVGIERNFRCVCEYYAVNGTFLSIPISDLYVIKIGKIILENSVYFLTLLKLVHSSISLGWSMGKNSWVGLLFHFWSSLIRL